MCGGLRAYLSTVPSRCVSEILWFSSRGKGGDICSVLPCLHNLRWAGEAAAGEPVGGGAEAHLDPPACWVD